MQLYFGELVDKGRFKYYCAGEHWAAGAERPPASAQSSHKIQCSLTNRFCDTQLRTSAYQMMVSIIFGSNDVDYLKDWTLNIEHWDSSLAPVKSEVQLLVHTENLGRQLNTDWKLLNAAQHTRDLDLFENKLEMFQGQISQWEENLERLQVEQFRLRCYMASLQASELPNPKVCTKNIFNFYSNELYCNTGTTF